VTISLHGRSALLIHAFAVGGVLHQLHRVEMLRALFQSSIAATRRGTTPLLSVSPLAECIHFSFCRRRSSSSGKAEQSKEPLHVLMFFERFRVLLVV
jgi:hypothetical protein